MQSRIDSFMEAVTNIIVGLIISTAANHVILPAVLDVQMTLGENLLIGGFFTLVSLVRGYALRRLFNGKSVWVAIKNWWSLPWRDSPVKTRALALGWLLASLVLIPLATVVYLLQEGFLSDAAEAYRDAVRALWKGTVRV